MLNPYSPIENTKFVIKHYAECGDLATNCAEDSCESEPLVFSSPQLAASYDAATIEPAATAADYQYATISIKIPGEEFPKYPGYLTISSPNWAEDDQTADPTFAAPESGPPRTCTSDQLDISQMAQQMSDQNEYSIVFTKFDESAEVILECTYYRVPVDQETVIGLN